MSGLTYQQRLEILGALATAIEHWEEVLERARYARDYRDTETALIRVADLQNTRAAFEALHRECSRAHREASA